MRQLARLLMTGMKVSTERAGHSRLTSSYTVRLPVYNRAKQ